MSHWITMKKLMKLFENLSENSLWVKDVMRTLSYTYWTNVILQNYHFLTPFLTLFRQNFSDFLIFSIFFERILIKINDSHQGQQQNKRIWWDSNPDLWKRNALIWTQATFWNVILVNYYCLQHGKTENHNSFC